MTAMLLTVALFGPSHSPDADANVLADAERDFAEGVNARNDAGAARRNFAAAAQEYDVLWHHGHRNAALALNRSRAHRLAGNLPAAIASLHDGLVVARYDRSLQVELEDARSAVAYSNGEMETQCRPHPVGGIGTRMSPLEIYLAAGWLWLLACLAAGRFAMTRSPGWFLAAAVMLASLVLFEEFLRRDWNRQANENAHPRVIAKDDCSLKLGNGDIWPDRLNRPLPRGVEARELSRRGGWVQIELANGAAGWLPANNLITD